MSCYTVLMRYSLFIGLWSALILLSPLLPNPGHAAEEAVEFEKAAALRIEGKNRRAVEAFDRILSVYPDHVAALVQKGAALEDQGKWKEAVKIYRRALEIDPKNVSASRNLRQLLSSKMMDTPLSGPSPAKEDLINRGLEALEKRDFQRAAETFTLSRGLSPDDPRPLFYLGFSLEKQGKIREALQAYGKTIEVFPDYLAARVQRTICLISSGDRKLAQQEIQKAGEILRDSLELRALRRVLNGPSSRKSGELIQGPGAEDQ
jgi:tetratricopeptide (TPR) repeat protein